MVSKPYRLLCLSLLSVSVVRDAVAFTESTPQEKASADSIFRFQFYGTRQSYRIVPEATLPEWSYENPDLETQLQLGVRWIELDIPDWSTRKVQNLKAFDTKSQCGTLLECLEQIRDWVTTENADDVHTAPVMVLVRVTDPFCQGGNTSCYEDLDVFINSILGHVKISNGKSLLVDGSLANFQRYGFNGNQYDEPSLSTLYGRIMIFADMNLATSDDIPSNAFDKSYFLSCPADFVNTAENGDYHKYCGVVDVEQLDGDSLSGFLEGNKRYLIRAVADGGDTPYYEATSDDTDKLEEYEKDLEEDTAGHWGSATKEVVWYMHRLFTVIDVNGQLDGKLSQAEVASYYDAVGWDSSRVANLWPTLSSDDLTSDNMIAEANVWLLLDPIFYNQLNGKVPVSMSETTLDLHRSHALEKAHIVVANKLLQKKTDGSDDFEIAAAYSDNFSSDAEFEDNEFYYKYEKDVAKWHSVILPIVIVMWLGVILCVIGDQKRRVQEEINKQLTSQRRHERKVEKKRSASQESARAMLGGYKQGSSGDAGWKGTVVGVQEVKLRDTADINIGPGIL